MNPTAGTMRSTRMEKVDARRDQLAESALLEHLTGTGTALPTLHHRAWSLLPSLISA